MQNVIRNVLQMRLTLQNLLVKESCLVYFQGACQVLGKVQRNYVVVLIKIREQILIQDVVVLKNCLLLGIGRIKFTVTFHYEGIFLIWGLLEGNVVISIDHHLVLVELLHVSLESFEQVIAVQFFMAFPVSHGEAFSLSFLLIIVHNIFNILLFFEFFLVHFEYFVLHTNLRSF